MLYRFDLVAGAWPRLVGTNVLVTRRVRTTIGKAHYLLTKVNGPSMLSFKYVESLRANKLMKLNLSTPREKNI